MRLIPLTDVDLWFRVRHREFDEDRLYRALALADYQESGRASLAFVTHNGYLWFVSQTQCIAASRDWCTGRMDEARLPAWPSERPMSDIEAGER